MKVQHGVLLFVVIVTGSLLLGADKSKFTLDTEKFIQELSNSKDPLTGSITILKRASEGKELSLTLLDLKDDETVALKKKLIDEYKKINKEDEPPFTLSKLEKVLKEKSDLLSDKEKEHLGVLLATQTERIILGEDSESKDIDIISALNLQALKHFDPSIEIKKSEIPSDLLKRLGLPEKKKNDKGEEIGDEPITYKKLIDKLTENEKKKEKSFASYIEGASFLKGLLKDLSKNKENQGPLISFHHEQLFNLEKKLDPTNVPSNLSYADMIRKINAELAEAANIIKDKIPDRLKKFSMPDGKMSPGSCGNGGGGDDFNQTPGPGNSTPPPTDTVSEEQLACLKEVKKTGYNVEMRGPGFACGSSIVSADPDEDLKECNTENSDGKRVVLNNRIARHCIEDKQMVGQTIQVNTTPNADEGINFTSAKVVGVYNPDAADPLHTHHANAKAVAYGSPDSAIMQIEVSCFTAKKFHSTNRSHILRIASEDEVKTLTDPLRGAEFVKKVGGQKLSALLFQNGNVNVEKRGSNAGAIYANLEQDSSNPAFFNFNANVTAKNGSPLNSKSGQDSDRIIQGDSGSAVVTCLKDNGGKFTPVSIGSMSNIVVLKDQNYLGKSGSIAFAGNDWRMLGQPKIKGEPNPSNSRSIASTPSVPRKREGTGLQPAFVSEASAAIH